MLRRIAPARGLFFLSPFVAEFLLGDVWIDALPIGLVRSPMYGAVRSSFARSRRRERMADDVFLAIAYAAIEEGLACQTLFNPLEPSAGCRNRSIIRESGCSGFDDSQVCAG